MDISRYWHCENLLQTFSVVKKNLTEPNLPEIGASDQKSNDKKLSL